MKDIARPLRVLIHLNHLELGGTQLNAVDFAAAGRPLGIEPMIVGARSTLPGDGPTILDVAAARGLPVSLYEDAPSRMPNARTLRRIAAEFSADLVHVYGSWGGVDGATYWGPALFGRTPWVQTVYEMSVGPSVKAHMPLIVGTEYLAEQLHDRPGRTSMISPPVDLVADCPDDAAGRAFRTEHALDGEVLVIVSRLDPNMKAYSIGVAIDAMRTLAAEGATLVVVGAGESMADLSARAAAVDEAVGRNAVKLVGPMSDPRPAYAAADVVLGMGGSAARALAFGRTLVVQGEAGWSQLFEPASAAALARNSYWSPDTVEDPVGQLVREVRSVLGDPQQRERLGAYGREFAERRFGLDAMTAGLAALYRDAARGYALRDWLADLPTEARVAWQKALRTVSRSGDARGRP